jgi:hypothetical protein
VPEARGSLPHRASHTVGPPYATNVYRVATDSSPTPPLWPVTQPRQWRVLGYTLFHVFYVVLHIFLNLAYYRYEASQFGPKRPVCSSQQPLTHSRRHAL